MTSIILENICIIIIDTINKNYCYVLQILEVLLMPVFVKEPLEGCL